MKIWDKGYDLDEEALVFTVGDDHVADMKLIAHDCIASKAHAKMLNSIGILNDDELESLLTSLDDIVSLVERGEFEVSREDEDCHTAIENYLIKRCGEAGEKIHAGRSRNDQVLTALRLFEKQELAKLKAGIQALVESLESVVERYGMVEIPGFTHMRKAMPSSFRLWAVSFIDALADQTAMVEAVYALVDQSPLGTAAGFGVPVLKLDRQMTARLMGFSRVQENPIYAQFSRGKFEGDILNLHTQVMLILNRLSSDLILYGMDELGFIKLPKEFCTGSSIMPHKVNPDVLELVRAKYHAVLAEEFKVKSMLGNLISGYNRDVQLTKMSLIQSNQITLESLSIMAKLVKGFEVDADACRSAMTSELYATERAHSLAKEGVPFRQAYRQIAGKHMK